MDLSHGLSLEQKQTLSMGQIQSLDILAYTNQELEDFLIKEYLENPLLENTFDKENDMLVNVERLYESGSSYGDLYLHESDEDDHSKRDIKAASENELKEYLLNQLNRSDFTNRQWFLMDYLIDCLDSSGYFSMNLEELAVSAHCQVSELNECLSYLKKLEPIGIFSSDLSECLEQQLRAIGQNDPLLFRLLHEYFKELMNGQIGVISRSLKIPTTKIKEYIHLLSTLNPRPIMNIQSEEPDYIIPDIIVTRQGDSWDITLNDGWMGEYKYSDYYIRMMEETTDPQLAAYFKERLERARFVVNSVEQRRKTILQIVQAVLEMQEDYFEHGGSLKPMQQEDIAQLLGIHVSTVSRAVKGKYIQYKKSILLRSLFSSAVTTAVSSSFQNQEVSSDQIKNRLQKLIETEGKKTLSDQKLAEKLTAEGIPISRRAITKYRIQLGIPDSRQRGLMAD